MNDNFKQCPNGHYYSAKLSQCPYCPGANAGASFGGATVSVGTAMGVPSPTTDANKTVDMSGMMGGMSGAGATMTADGFVGADGATRMPGDAPVAVPTTGDRTMIFEEETTTNAAGEVVHNGEGNVRSRRKLVGWLVSYTLDEMGIDFKLYEGKNVIGRKMECQITLQDSTVSGEHATILFRAGKFSIRDMQSTQGTFVNDEDIELDAHYIKDGDILRLGKTVLKFRTAL